MDKDNEITVSVVIPTKDGGQELDRCLAAAFSQKVDVNFEVLCIDSGSKDETLKIFQKYPVRLFQIDKNDFNHGLTRNFGISQARGKYVILMTQDAVPCDEHWMDLLIRNIQKDDHVAGVYCRQIPREDADVLTKRNCNQHTTAGRKEAVSFIHDRREYEALKPIEKYLFCNFDNVCSCIRKSIWEEIPFSKIDFAEDLDWSKKVLESGYKIVYEPDAAVIHSHKGSIFDKFRRTYIHHKKLYELFGFQPIASLPKVFLYSFINTLRDIYFVAIKEKSFAKKVSLILKIPLLSFLEIWIQYKGAKDATYENSAGYP